MQALLEASGVVDWLDLNLFLQNSADRGALTIARAVLRHGHGVSATSLTSKQVSTLVLAAVRRNDLETIALLLGGCGVNFAECGEAVREAAYLGRDALIRVLIDEAGCPSDRCPHGRHAIHMAASAGHIAVLQALCASGCDIDTPVVAGPGPTENATAVHFAAFSGRVEMLYTLATLKCNINPPGAWGSPVVCATIASQCEAIRTLCSLRCNPDCYDKYGHTAVYQAMGGERIDALRTLANVRADINLRSTPWDSAEPAGADRPIHSAIRKAIHETNNLIALKVLVEMRADLSVRHGGTGNLLDYARACPDMNGQLSPEASSRARTVAEEICQLFTNSG